MKIEIGEKIRPFSHHPSIRVLVPGSNWIVQAFPALLRIEGHCDLPIHVTGPVKEFTVQLDLEKRTVLIWGIAKEGYYKFTLEAWEEGLTLFVDRAPKEGIQVGDKLLQRKEKILLVTGGSCLPVKPVEKLSLGNLKSQEWDQVWRRMDLKEIVPALFLLGQMVPKQGESKGGTEALLKEGLDRFVPAAFSNLLIPRLVDEQHQALAPATPVTGEPLSLLPKVYRQIRSFLIEEANPTIRILPKLPPDWDCGRAVGFHVEGLGDFDLEWSRNQIRKMVLRSHRASETKVVFAKPVDSYRLNGVRVENGTAISFEGGKIYTFDRFQK